MEANWVVGIRASTTESSWCRQQYAGRKKTGSVAVLGCRTTNPWAQAETRDPARSDFLVQCEPPKTDLGVSEN